MHSITLPQNPPTLRENIFKVAATLLGCGIDPTKSTLFVQSSVMEHCEFNWILNGMTTMARLGHLPQFKEKSRLMKEVPLGLYVYPVLQAADIMLYKATHVPVGADQVQHIQLAQHLARTFNNRYGPIFPVCHAIVNDSQASRIQSLRDPKSKMSKSDKDLNATINICDTPDVIVEKCKKALTDIISDIEYEPQSRPGVSNLVTIHSLITNTPIKKIVDEAISLDTGKYKMRVAEAIIEHLAPIRERVKNHLLRHNELIYLLEIGAEKARQTAQQTMMEVKQRVGLGTYPNVPKPIEMIEISPMQPKGSNYKDNANQSKSDIQNSDQSSSAAISQNFVAKFTPKTIKMSSPKTVPSQKMRIEKHYKPVRTQPTMIVNDPSMTVSIESIRGALPIYKKAIEAPTETNKREEAQKDSIQDELKTVTI